MAVSRRFDLLVFDFDGTLVDSSADIARCLALAFADVDHPIEEEALLREMGHPLEDVWRRFTGARPVGSRYARFVDCYRTHHEVHGVATTAPFPGVIETLSVLEGPRRAIATTKPTHRVRQQAALFSLDAHFHHIQGTDGFAPKPDPEILARVFAALPAEPSRVLVIGDTERDVEAGRRAGCATAAVTWGARERDFLRALGPDFLLERFEDLLGIAGR